MSIRSVEGRWGTIYYEGKDEYVGKSLHNYGEYRPALYREDNFFKLRRNVWGKNYVSICRPI